jgi:hypothetical protein
MKNLHQKILRLSSQTNYRVIYEDTLIVVYSDSRKPPKNKDIKVVKDFEEKIDQLKNDHKKLPQVIQEECCKYFETYYKGRVQKLLAKTVGTRRQTSCQHKTTSNNIDKSVQWYFITSESDGDHLVINFEII